jgi:hypothetical protein
MKIVKSRSVIGCGAAVFGLIAVSPLHASLTHRYSFDTPVSAGGTVNDLVGSANGTLVNSATVSGGLLQLNNPAFPPGGDGNPDPNGYLSLPASILPSSGEATIEEWFTMQGSGFYTESYTFTNAADTGTPSAGQYLMHTISAPMGGPNTGTAGGNHVVEGPYGYNPGPEIDAYGTTPGMGAFGQGYLDNGDSCFSATVFNSDGTMSYYLYDITTNSGGLQQTVTGYPLSDFNFTAAYLGRSAFTGDNGTDGVFDEFRIFNNAQSAANVAANFAAGPDDANIQVPEPVSLSFIAFGVFGLLARRPNRRTAV